VILMPKPLTASSKVVRLSCLGADRRLMSMSVRRIGAGGLRGNTMVTPVCHARVHPCQRISAAVRKFLLFAKPLLGPVAMSVVTQGLRKTGANRLKICTRKGYRFESGRGHQMKSRT